MKMFLISDDLDTLLGMRLAGVKGKQVAGVQDFLEVFTESVHNKELGILLITQKLSEEFEHIINPHKLNEQPLILSMI